jgi:hypothetical protein
MDPDLLFTIAGVVEVVLLALAGGAAFLVHERRAGADAATAAEREPGDGPEAPRTDVRTATRDTTKGVG